MSSKKQLLVQFDLLNHWFVNALDGISDEESNKRIHPEMNHIKYLAGHLTNALYGVADSAGEKTEHRWDDLFAGLGKTKALDNFAYPAIGEIKTEWDKIWKLTKARLEALSDSDLTKELPGGGMSGTGIFDGTLGDYWAFMNEHQMYHIGQIGILRRALGKKPMELF